MDLIAQTRLAVLLSSILFIATESTDPCRDASVYTTGYIGQRNEFCIQPHTGSPYCDGYIPNGWYKIEDGVMVTKCPSEDCSVTHPVWLNVSSLPDVSSGIVNGTACVKKYGGCCKDSWPLRVKNCSGFYVYELTATKEGPCESGYCFESRYPCHEPQTTTISTTTEKEGTTTQYWQQGDLPPALLAVIIVVLFLGLAALLTVVLVVLVKYQMCCTQHPSKVCDQYPGVGQVPSAPPPTYDSIKHL